MRYNNRLIVKGSIVFARFHSGENLAYLNDRPLLVVFHPTTIYDNITVCEISSKVNSPGILVSLLNLVTGEPIGLMDKSYIKPYKIQTIPKNRISTYQGTLDRFIMKEVDEAIKYHLGLSDDPPGYIKDTIYNQAHSEVLYNKMTGYEAISETLTFDQKENMSKSLRNMVRKEAENINQELHRNALVENKIDMNDEKVMDDQDVLPLKTLRMDISDIINTLVKDNNMDISDVTFQHKDLDSYLYVVRDDSDKIVFDYRFTPNNICKNIPIHIISGLIFGDLYRKHLRNVTLFRFKNLTGSLLNEIQTLSRSIQPSLNNPTPLEIFTIASYLNNDNDMLKIILNGNISENLKVLNDCGLFFPS